MSLVEKPFTIKAPWGKIRGLSWGDPQDPPVFLCHGKQDACSGFRGLVRALGNVQVLRFHYVAVDLPGNGLSDPFPPGVRLTALDLVPTIKYVKEHFKWDKFVFIGHSLGSFLGKIFDIVYPGHITRLVEIDPVPAYDHYTTSIEHITQWYFQFYESFYGEQYNKLNKGVEGAPKYSLDKLVKLLMSSRSLPRHAAEDILERSASPAGDGLYRLTYDQRYKHFTRFLFLGDMYKVLYTESKTPTLCIIAKISLESGWYEPVPFLIDSAWSNGNYRFSIVDGGHDVHINNPECLVDEIIKFLMEDLISKL